MGTKIQTKYKSGKHINDQESDGCGQHRSNTWQQDKQSLQDSEGQWPTQHLYPGTQAIKWEGRTKLFLAPKATSIYHLRSVQFSSVAQSCPTLCDPMNCSTPGLPVHHKLLEFTQTHVHRSWWCHPAILSSVVPFSSCPQSLPASGSFPMSQLFSWVGQSIGVSVSASVLPLV